MKLLLRMRNDSGTRSSSWTVVGRRAAALLGLGRLLLPGASAGVCLGAVLPSAVTGVFRVGTTRVLLLLPLGLEVGITTPPPVEAVGATELLFVVVLAWGETTTLGIDGR